MRPTQLCDASCWVCQEPLGFKVHATHNAISLRCGPCTETLERFERDRTVPVESKGFFRKLFSGEWYLSARDAGDEA